MLRERRRSDGRVEASRRTGFEVCREVAWDALALRWEGHVFAVTGAVFACSAVSGARYAG